MVYRWKTWPHPGKLATRAKNTLFIILMAGWTYSSYSDGFYSELINISWMWGPMGITWGAHSWIAKYLLGVVYTPQDAQRRLALWVDDRGYLLVLPVLFVDAAYEWGRLFPLGWSWLRTAREQIDRPVLAWLALSLAVTVIGSWIIISFHTLVKGPPGSWLQQPQPESREVSEPRHCSILALAHEMSKRQATNDRDKVAGLAYLVRCPSLS